MGLLDNLGLGDTLKGMLGQAEAAAVPMVISAVLAKTNLGDLQGLATKLQASGLSPQVASWLGSHANMTITPDQLRAALGNAQVQELAKHFGLPADEALKYLADHLPATIDQASPHGTIVAKA